MVVIARQVFIVMGNVGSGTFGILMKVPNVFIKLNNMPIEITERHIKVLEMYLMEVYFPAKVLSYSDIDDARVKRFFKFPGPNYD